MTLGYQCDADCENLADQAFGTITLDLSALPETQGLQLAVLMNQQGLVDLDDATLMQATMALRDKSAFDLGLPTVELHLCAGHTLTILDQMGIADIPQDPEEGVDESEFEVDGQST